MLDVSAGPGKFKRCIRLVIADPQPIVLMGLNSVFATQHDFEIVASCGCGTSCLEAIRNLAPDVALVAGTLPDLTISEILAIARAENLPTRLMFFAESQGDDDLTAAIAAGACNAVSAYADPDTILRSLRLTTEGASASPKLSRELSSNKNDVDGTKIEKMLRALTHRERQIIQLVSEGLSNKEIARELNVSRGTVKVHLYNIFQKLEVSNRTVLATIALLQRSTGLTTLSLALAFAMLSDVRTSDATDTLRDDDSAAKDLEHSVFEFCKKAILRHDIVADPGERILLSQKDSTNKEVQLSHSAGRMEGLHAAEQAAFSNIGKGYGTIGSSTLSLFISPFQQAINNSQAGNLTSLPPPAFPSHTIRGHGGSGLFAMTAAAMGVITLDNSHAALQACEPGKTLSDASVVSDQDGVTHVATINGHVDSNAGSANVENLASELVGQDSRQSLVLGTFGHDKTAGKGNAGEIIQGAAGDDSLNSNGSSNVLDGSSGDNTIKDNGGDDTIQGGSGSDIINGSDATIGMHGGDKLTGGHGDADSNSTRFDTIDFTSGADRINLAAFGALAFLHLTSASQSVPPHTLAWIYNPLSNETIVYVNPTDHSLDIGDAGLLEIHLQGVVSVAESDFVHQPNAAAIAAALEGIDPALLVAVANDGTVLTTDSVHAGFETLASESTLGTAGVWSSPTEDGLRFHFGQDRIDANVSTRHTSFDDSDYGTKEQHVGAVIVPTPISSIETANSHTTVLNNEKLALKTEPIYSNNGAEKIGHGNPHATVGLEFFDFNMQNFSILAPVAVAETVEPGAPTGNSRAHDNSQHASHAVAASAKEVAEPVEPGVASGHGGGHGNSKHASKAAAEEAPAAVELTEPAGLTGHGNPEHPSHPASAKALAAGESTELDGSSDRGGHNNSHHAIHPAATSVLEVAEPVEPGNGVGHSNSQIPSSSASVSAMEAASGGHGHSPQASHTTSANTSAITQPAAPAPGAGGAGPQSAFHFKNEAPSSTATAAIDLEEFNSSPVSLVHNAELTAILEMGPAAMDEHATGHVHSGPHNALAHVPHELLT